ncbi:unnamed protein product, partial [Soboliphyme baturini]|uniref:TSP1_spondin domain-containing protein n=1 Tax=Soboliphyme baturini TaxID=241478 RepID=A0A183J2G6_9BILA
IDCRTSEWSSWSPCEKVKETQKIKDDGHNDKCGTGISRRAKVVTQSPKNGGAPCGMLEEQRACFIDNKACESAIEVANLVSYTYHHTRARGYKKKTYYEVPRLMEKYKVHKNYCSLFTLIWLNPACDDVDLTETLKVGISICAECQTGAHRKQPNGTCIGDGVQYTSTMWNMLYTRRCYGYWRKLLDSTDCDCATFYPEMPKYLFV